MIFSGTHDHNTAWSLQIQCILHGINDSHDCFQWDPMTTTLPGLYNGVNNMTVMMFSVGPLDNCIAWSVHCTQNTLYEVH